MSQYEPAPADHCFVYQSGGWPDSIRGREEREMIRRSMDAAENSWTLITGRLLGHHEIISCHFPFSLQNGKPRPRESQGGTCPETHRELKPEPGVGRERSQTSQGSWLPLRCFSKGVDQRGSGGPDGQGHCHHVGQGEGSNEGHMSPVQQGAEVRELSTIGRGHT